MKKLIALLLALVMVTCMATVAFGTEGNGPEGNGSSTPTFNNDPSQPNLTVDEKGVIKKEYTVNNGTAPAETFTFSFEGLSYKNNEGKTETVDIPAISNQTISFDAITATTDKTAEFEINPNDYELGVYTYKVTEVIPADGAKTAGTTYDTKPMYLVLTILRDESDGKHYVAAMHYESETGSKEEGFKNSYDAGQLTVTKYITGNMADMTKEFSFTITFTAPEGEIIDSQMKIIVGNNPGYELWTPGANSAAYTNSIGDGESIVITNIPEGVTYTITEEKGEYTQSSITGEEVNNETGTVTGTIEANAEDTATYTNELKSEVDTGVALDSAPYIVMLVVAMAGVVALVSKKRYEV